MLMLFIEFHIGVLCLKMKKLLCHMMKKIRIVTVNSLL